MFLLDGSRSGRWLRLTFCALRAFRTFGTLHTLRTLCSFRAFYPLWPLGAFSTLRDRRANIRLLEVASRRFAVTAMTVAIRRLITFAPAETAFTLIVVATMGAPVVAVAVALPVALIAITTIAPEILTVATVPAIAPIEPLLVAAIIAVVAVVVEALVARLPIVVAILIVEVARLLLLLRERLLRVRLRATLAKLRLRAELVTVLVAEVLAIRTLRPGKRMRPRGAVAHGIDTALLRHLLAIAENDAVVVLGVLEIIFGQHGIA